MVDRARAYAPAQDGRLPALAIVLSLGSWLLSLRWIFASGWSGWWLVVPVLVPVVSVAGGVVAWRRGVRSVATGAWFAAGLEIVSMGLLVYVFANVQ